MDGPSRAELNAGIIAEFRRYGGRVSGELARTPLILVHHVGARSGVERVVPLAYYPQPDGRLAIIASNGGSLTHPDWYHNLKAHPKVTVEVGTETFQVVAHELDGAARSIVWPTVVAASPAAGEFQRRTTRLIPVFLLTRED